MVNYVSVHAAHMSAFLIHESNVQTLDKKEFVTFSVKRLADNKLCSFSRLVRKKWKVDVYLHYLHRLYFLVNVVIRAQEAQLACFARAVVPWWLCLLTTCYVCFLLLVKISPPGHLRGVPKKAKLCLKWQAPLLSLSAHLQYEVSYQIRGGEAWMVR